MKKFLFLLSLLFTAIVGFISTENKNARKAGPAFSEHKFISYAGWQATSNSEWNLGLKTNTNSKGNTEINQLPKETRNLHIYREAVQRGEIVMGVSGLN